MWLWDLVADRAERSPDLLCAVDEAGRTLRFGELAEHAEHAAAGFAEAGIAPGDAVFWQLPTWIETIVATAALSRLGAMQVPLLPILRGRELSVALRQVQPRLILCPSTWRGTDYVALWRNLVDEHAPGEPAPQILVCDRTLPETSTDIDTLPSLDAARPPAGEHRWVFFTSGTTGVPKGARHTDDSLGAGSAAFVQRTRLTERDRYPIVFPFTHVGGVGTFVAQLLTGMTAVLDDSFDAERTIPYLSASDITIGAGGTPFVQLFLQHQRRDPATPLFSNLRLCLSGVAPKPPTLHADSQAELGGRGCISVYGLTEAPFSTISDLDDDDHALATKEGRPIDGCDLRVVGLDGRPCATDEEGELRIKGPQVMLGYLDASLDADAFDEEGWFRSGDLARLDAHRNVTITGRIKEIIIRRGENISALEVEHVLLGHPDVADIAVIGLPDERTGERCCAVIVPAPGRTPALAGLSGFAAEAGLARQKHPEQLVLVDALPRNAAGKVLKHELRASILGPQRHADGRADDSTGARR